ncbi:MAG: hypothetical protein ABEJ42_06360 [Halobacteriaceae archaeon]
MTREDTDDTTVAAEFSDALADLKRRGSMLLLAGVAHDSLAGACTRLSGEGNETRRRLVVSTDRQQADAGPGTRRIHYATDARSASAAHAADAGIAGHGGPSAGPAAGPAAPDPGVRTVDGDLSDLIGAIRAEVDEIDAATGGLDPAQLRVCFDSADTVLAAHDREATFEFFHALSGVLVDARAMGHVHLPAPFGDEVVQVLSPLFDAVIEVRTGGRQRWHLREPELTTDWLTF